MKFVTTLHLVFHICFSNLKDILKHIRNDNNFLKYNNTKMKRELGYIYREPQIILRRAACGSRAAGWPPHKAQALISSGGDISSYPHKVINKQKYIFSFIIFIFYKLKWRDMFFFEKFIFYHMLTILYLFLPYLDLQRC